MNKLQSTQDYLETILILSEEKGNVRAIDIAKHLQYSRASISIALKKLKADGYVKDSDKDSYIRLTRKGARIARDIYEKHETLTQLFISLGVNPEIAEADACKIEHYLSDETFKKIKKHYAKHIK
ncbi:MAG: metal-dependent transcriptional regulator [Bacillales bacterium]